MNLCPSARASRAAMPAGNRSAPAARISRRHQRHAEGKFQFHPACYGPGGLSQLLGLAQGLAMALIIAAFTASAQGQTSVTLAWDPSPDSAIAGYRLYDGVASVIDVGNATSATVSNLVNGVTYFFAVTAYDTNGEESDFSNAISYTVPWPTNGLPTLALTSPANGAVYTEPATINFAADVMPNGHMISQVQFYDGVTVLGEATTAPYAFTWGSVPAGTYSLIAQVVYDSGSTVASAAVNVTVAAVRPPFGLTFVADSGTNSLPFSVTLAWAPSPDSAITGYRLYELVASETDTNVIDVTDVGNATSAAVTNLTNGVTYFFAVTALDRNGQESYFSDEIIYKVFSATNSPPRPPSGLTFVADSGTISPPFSVTLAWAPSPDSAIAGYRLYELVASETDTNVIDVTDVGNATSATVTNLTNGVTYFFAVTARDTFGQESAFSDEISYKVPWPTNGPLTLALALPANGAVYTAPATINFAAGVTPNGHTISRVQFYNGVTLLGVRASAPYSFSWHNVGAGTYSLSARVVYDSGSTVASAPFNVTVASRKIGSFYRLQEQ